MTKKHSKLHIIKSLAHYGVHIWAILIIANAALAYAFHFSTQASENTQILQEAEEPEAGKGTEKEEDTKKTKADEEQKPAKPLGATISLAFQIPGIGSGSANMTPARLERNLIVFLYTPDANSLNNSVKPLYTIKAKVNYDTSTSSPTYTSYIVKDLDLGGDVKEGNYQIAFRTDESLRTLIKESPENVGGKIFDLKKTTRERKIPPQKVLMGDTLPEDGDNVVDISDYNAFVNCFGERSSTEFCVGHNYGDFDDNGAIDGVDYNLLLRSFGELLKQGQSIPKITQAPTGPARVSRLSNLVTPTKAEKKPSPTKAEEKPTASNSSGNVLGGILFFIFILIAGAVIFILFKKNEKFRNLVKALLNKSPIGKSPPPPPTPADPNAPAAGGAEATATESTAAIPPVADSTAAETPPAPADPSAVAASTEMPVGQAPETPPQDASTVAASTEIPVAVPAADAATAETPAPAPEPTAATPAVGESVEKECYVKKKLPGDATGVWLTLTDDNGALEAHYSNPEVQEGFAKVKGVMKTENGKTFLEISELVGEG